MLNKLNSNNLNAFKCNLKELSTKSALNDGDQRSVACAVLEFLHVVTKTFVACFPVHHAGC